jgi:hypothetical protein
MEKNLLDDLLWAHCNISVGRKAKLSRPTEYRAPPWSWAAVDGNVAWPIAHENGRGPYLAGLVDCRIERPDENIFGQVIGGSIRLCGSLKHIARRDGSGAIAAHNLKVPAEFCNSVCDLGDSDYMKSHYLRGILEIDRHNSREYQSRAV